MNPNDMNQNHYSQAARQKKLARDDWENKKTWNNKSVAEQILKTATQGFTKAHLPKHPTLNSDDMLRRVTALQSAGYITNAKVNNVNLPVGESTLVVEFTHAGIQDIFMRDTTEMLDTTFLEDQIAEYSDQIPKAFLEGLKAAEGILRGTDFLENYIAVK
jgi:hypothetical protein